PACPPFCAFFGTSAAAPHSAGIAALLLDQDPTLTPAEVQAALTRGAVDIGPQGFDDASGFGRIDALAAAQPSTGSTTTPPALPPAPAPRHPRPIPGAARAGRGRTRRGDRSRRPARGGAGACGRGPAPAPPRRYRGARVSLAATRRRRRVPKR